tara:strand:+ start:1050 stop:1511 length:462 start_codon:yes stop_codon:yes gene_type:complete
MATKYCEWSRDTILKGMKAGHTRESVCKKVGISTATLLNWLKDEGKREFAVLLAKAEGEGTIQLVEQVKFHGQKDWRAAAWILERTRPAFMKTARMSSDSKRRIDALAIEKLQADIDYVKAKTEALKGSDLSTEDIRQILSSNDRRDDADSVH